MIELRWYDYGNRILLQYRTRQATISDGALQFSEWSDWTLVPMARTY